MTNGTGSKHKLAIRIGYVITLVWAVSFISDIAMTTYSPPETIHGLMLVVAGWLYREGIFPRKEEKGGTIEKETANE